MDGRTAHSVFILFLFLFIFFFYKWRRGFGPGASRGTIPARHLATHFEQKEMFVRNVWVDGTV
jgi:hypothetical protein